MINVKYGCFQLAVTDLKASESMSKQGAFSSTTIALLIVGLVIGAGGGYFASSSSLRPKIDDLENQVSSLNSEVATLDAEVNALGEENSDLETQVSELITERSSLETQLETAQVTISEKENDISYLEEAIEDYEDQIEELTAQLEIYIVTPGYNKFSIYGLSFEYPEGYTTSLSGLLESTATENSGYVTATSMDESESYYVVWMYTLITPDLDVGLDGGLAELEPFNLKLGPRETSELNGHVMRYQDFSITEVGVQIYGVMATAYCTDSKKFLILQIMLAENPEVFPIFWQFIESIICH